MKNKILLIAGFLILVTSVLFTVKSQETDGKLPKESTITIMSTPDLYNLVIKWSEEYNKVSPGNKISVKSMSPSAASQEQNAGNDLTFISSEYSNILSKKAEWHLTVGRDAIVPIMNQSNPLLYSINEKGVSQEKLSTASTDLLKQNWGTLIGTGQNIPLHLYLPYNGHVSEIVASFLNTPLAQLKYTTVANEKELIEAIQKDPNGIGFSKMINVFDKTDQSLPENICLLPIDKNNNGTLDYHERIYENWQSFLRGVWIGKYPHALCQSIYTVANLKPENKAQVDFLKWVLTSGQVYLNDYGYFDLVYSDRQSGLDKLSNSEIAVVSGSGVSAKKVALFSLAILLVIGILVTILASYIREKRREAMQIRISSSGILDESSVQVMEGLYYDRSHTWSFMERDGNVKVGIDDFLQHVTGPLSCVKMKKAGDKVSKGEIFLSIIQEGKRLNIKSPVTGVIKEHNDVLILNSSLINTSPFSDGWVYLIEPSNWLKEIQSLIMGERYKTWLKSEITRLKDFLATSLKSHQLELSAVALQDGGPMQDNVLAGLGPEVWDDFQTQYLDTAI